MMTPRPPVARAALYARACRTIDALIEATARDGGIPPREASILVHKAAAIKLGSTMGATSAALQLRRVANEIEGRS